MRDGRSPESENQKMKPIGKSRKADSIVQDFNQILDEMRKLEHVIKDMYKPKQEIKEVSIKMNHLTEEIYSGNVTAFLKTLNKPKDRELKKHADVQSLNYKILRQKILSVKT